jgi:Na+/melibiose symporter-like transporter
MFMNGLWMLLHLFFAFSFVGSLVVAEWNGRAARMSQDWSQRALLFGIVQLSSRVAGFGALILTGLLGNLVAMRAGYRMPADVWMRWVNGLWIAAVLVMILLVLPNAGRLASISRSAAEGGSSDGFASALARWRFGNLLQSVLYLSLLALMVFHWRS